MTKTAQKLFISSAALVAAEKKMEEDRAKKMVWSGHEIKGLLEQADTPPISPSNWKPAFLDVDKKQKEASKTLTGEAVDAVKSKAHKKKKGHKALAGETVDEATKAKMRIKMNKVGALTGEQRWVPTGEQTMSPQMQQAVDNSGAGQAAAAGTKACTDNPELCANAAATAGVGAALLPL
ncbi:unnamed protein product [Amoebophrya sp. A120]|nr:unnamed protein product [Amoebophrya sp. A120]|eukprot:GSA120T00007000001.1